jgi:hypothetical protein
MYFLDYHSRAKDMRCMLPNAVNTPAATWLMNRCTSTLHVFPERAWQCPRSTTANHATGMEQGRFLYNLARAVNIAAETWCRSCPKQYCRCSSRLARRNWARLVSRIESQDLAAISPRTSLWRAILASKDPFDSPFSTVTRSSLRLNNFQFAYQTLATRPLGRRSRWSRGSASHQVDIRTCQQYFVSKYDRTPVHDVGNATSSEAGAINHLQTTCGIDGSLCICTHHTTRSSQRARRSETHRSRTRN